MKGKRQGGDAWHETTVVLRSDIYRQAEDRGIDISDTCNRALAVLTGIAYDLPKQEDSPPPPPVIIAKNGALPRTRSEPVRRAGKALHPVINADDPAAPAKAVQAKPPQKEKPENAPEPAAVAEPPAAVAAGKRAAPGGRKAPARKHPKGEVLRTFFAQRIIRTGDAGDLVGKSELYEIFARFCREHRVTPVPERKAVTVALKNQFALTEKTADGNPAWAGIRLK